jgi:hypothetical protein
MQQQQQNAPQIPLYQTIAAGSPLARVQADESASGKRREWRVRQRGRGIRKRYTAL